MDSSGRLPSILHLKSQAVVSFKTTTTDDGELDSEYVLGIEETCDGSHCAVSVSDGSLRVYASGAGSDSFSPGNLLVNQNCGERIQVLKCSTHAPHILYTAFADGGISVCDIRTATPAVQKISVQVSGGDELTAMDLSHADTLLAAAVGNSVYFYDMRRAMTSGSDLKSSLLGQYSDCHSDMITQLRFNTTNPAILTSAGEDGLLCTYDTSAPANSEAVASVLNTECPIRNFFYFGQDSSGICCMSTVETLSCWHYPSAQRICHFPSIRSSFALDYLVDGWYKKSTDSLYIIGGDYSGKGLVLSVSPQQLSPVAVIAGGHTASIRCCASRSQGTAIITGGEDAKLCHWTSDSSSRSSMRPHSSSSKTIKSSSRRVGPGSNPY